MSEAHGSTSLHAPVAHDFFDKVNLDAHDLIEGYRTEGYKRHSEDSRAGAFELNWRLKTTNGLRQAYFARRLESFGFRRLPAQYQVLRDIHFSGGSLAQSQIAEYSGVGSANVTRLVHGLERNGLVQREVNPDDKRSTIVSLTDAGRSFCQRIIPVMGRDIRRVADCFSDAELAMFNEFLARLHAHIEVMAADFTE